MTHNQNNNNEGDIKVIIQSLPPNPYPSELLTLSLPIQLLLVSHVGSLFYLLLYMHF